MKVRDQMPDVGCFESETENSFLKHRTRAIIMQFKGVDEPNARLAVYLYSLVLATMIASTRVCIRAVRKMINIVNTY